MKKGANKRGHPYHKIDPARRAVLKFTVFHDPESDKVPSKLPSEEPTKKPQQDIRAQQADRVSTSNPTSDRLKNPPSRMNSQAKSAKDSVAGNLYTLHRGPEPKTSDSEEERRFANAKPVRALIHRPSSRSTALSPVDAARSLVRWRRRSVLLRRLKSLPLWEWAKFAGILSIFGVIFVGSVYLGVKAWKRHFSASEATDLVQVKEVRKSDEKQKNRSTGGKNPRRRANTAASGDNLSGKENSLGGEPDAINGGSEEPTEVWPEPPPMTASSGEMSPATKSANTASQVKPQTPTLPAKASDEIKPPFSSSVSSGTIISMAVVKSVRSAYATTVPARVTTDVRDKSGQIFITSGTIVLVPLGSPDDTGRFSSEHGSSVWITLADGAEIPLKVSVQGADGSSGLAGKRKKPGWLGKIIRGVGEAGAALGQEFETTRGAAQALEEALPDRTEGGGIVAEIKAGTRFTLLVR